MQAFRGIAVTKDVDFWDFLGSRDLEGLQMWAFGTFVTLFSSLSSMLGISLYQISSASAFIRYYQHHIMSAVSGLTDADKVKWIVVHYLAFSLWLREPGVHENMYDGVAIRYPKFISFSFTLSPHHNHHVEFFPLVRIFP